MKPRREKLGDAARVKGTMVSAHLDWGRQRAPDLDARLASALGPEERRLVETPILATDWVPLRALVAIDRAIAAAAGGDPEAAWRAMGRHSALVNLSGAYKGFAADEPHKFFERQARLHGRFQDFGRAGYERVGERAGRIRLEDYAEYSPVYCASAGGFYCGALETMHVPGPIRAVESACTCAGDTACVFDLSW